MQTCKLENSPIVYYVSGREHDEWVLFLHAAFVTHEMFREQTKYFGDKYNVLTLDIIGHGESTDTGKGESISMMSEWIHGILQAEGIREIHIAGISLGAVLAQDFANRYPDAVSSLACFGGYDINNFDPGLQKKNGAAQMAMMIKAVFSVRWFAKANMRISAYTPRAQEEFYNMNLRFPRKSFRYLASLGSLINQHPAGQRNYPLLIGCGQFDIPEELTAVRQWKQHESSCTLTVFENAGHCVNMDVPGEFNAALEKFWSGRDRD